MAIQFWLFSPLSASPAFNFIGLKCKSIVSRCKENKTKNELKLVAKMSGGFQRKCSTGRIDCMLFAKFPKILAAYFPRQSLNILPRKVGLVKASQQHRPSITTDWYELDPEAPAPLLRVEKRPEFNFLASVFKLNGR